MTNEDLEIGLLQTEAELTETQIKLKAAIRGSKARCLHCIYSRPNPKTIRSSPTYEYQNGFITCASRDKKRLDPKWNTYWIAAFYPKYTPRCCDFYVSKEKYDKRGA